MSRPSVGSSSTSNLASIAMTSARCSCATIPFDNCRTFGTDDSENTALFNTQVYPIERDSSAENFAETACFYGCHGIGEVSRKGAKPLRFGTEIRSFDVSVLFALLRLSVKNSSLPRL